MDISRLWLCRKLIWSGFQFNSVIPGLNHWLDQFSWKSAGQWWDMGQIEGQAKPEKS
jgi:hypothetical protein